MPAAARIFQPRAATCCRFARFGPAGLRWPLLAILALTSELLGSGYLAAQSTRPAEAPYLPPDAQYKNGDWSPPPFGPETVHDGSSLTNGPMGSPYPPPSLSAQPPRSLAKGQTPGSPRLWEQPGGSGPSETIGVSQHEPGTLPGSEPSSDARSRRGELPRMSRSSPADSARLDHSASPVGGLASLVTIGGSLALVVGLFLVFAWIMRRSVPQATVALPTDVVEVLGRAPLAARQQVHLLRCGKKLLLVSVTPDGAETLTEITEPEEVDRLAGICRQAQPTSATKAFRHVLGQFAAQATEPGFVDQTSVTAPQPVPRGST